MRLGTHGYALDPNSYKKINATPPSTAYLSVSKIALVSLSIRNHGIAISVYIILIISIYQLSWYCDKCIYYPDYKALVSLSISNHGIAISVYIILIIKPSCLYLSAIMVLR